MITIRFGAERGATKIDWLDSKHTFSFNRYYDPNHMGFHHLRVINEDTVAPGAGFGTHSHQDMEIVTYVLKGALSHRDSVNAEGATIHAGEVQRMSAGTGISHSEYNASHTEPAYFFQIWIAPERIGITPGYEQKLFTLEDRTNLLRLIAAKHPRNGSLKIHQDFEIHVARIEAGRTVTHHFATGRHVWVQTASAYGGATVNGATLAPGDAAALTDETAAVISAGDRDAEILLFDTADVQS
jgi:hypothetical protein